MISNKLITLLETFSKQDLNQFQKFLHSPFFNESEDLIQLYALLYPHLLKDKVAYPKEVVKKEAAWTILFPKAPYKDVKMRRLCSDLTKQAYQYLSIKKFKKETTTQKAYLLDALNDVTLSKQYNSVYNSIKDETNILKDATYYHQQHVLHTNHYLFQIKQRKNFQETFQLANHHLDCYYFLVKLKKYCGELGNRRSVNIEKGIKIIPNLFAYLEAAGFDQEPSIHAYLLVIKLLTEPEDETHFWNLKDFLGSDSSFSKNDLNELYAHLMNYCAIKLATGNTDYYHHLFDLYKVALDKKVIIEKNRLDFQQYKNIINIGLKVKAYDWVEQFIPSYTPLLSPDKRENALNFNLAKVYFSQQQYDKVIEQLSTVAYKSHIYAIGGKTILLKTYFELKEYQALDSLLDSFRIYIRRNKLISREVQQQNLNFLRFVKKIASALPKDYSTIEKIQNQINKCKALAGKQWLLVKLGELK